MTLQAAESMLGGLGLRLRELRVEGAPRERGQAADADAVRAWACAGPTRPTGRISHGASKP
jgi:hypothetical protein